MTILIVAMAALLAGAVGFLGIAWASRKDTPQPVELSRLDRADGLDRPE